MGEQAWNPTRNDETSPFPKILSEFIIFDVLLSLVILTREKRNLKVVLVCISLLIKVLDSIWIIS